MAKGNKLKNLIMDIRLCRNYVHNFSTEFLVLFLTGDPHPEAVALGEARQQVTTFSL